MVLILQVSFLASWKLCAIYSNQRKEEKFWNFFFCSYGVKIHKIHKKMSLLGQKAVPPDSQVGIKDLEIIFLKKTAPRQPQRPHTHKKKSMYANWSWGVVG